MSGELRDPVGTLLAGRYEVTHVIGEESLGRVWAARDLKSGGLVQVKVLLPYLAVDPVRFARFGREMTASFLVTHPNTIEVQDYGQEDGIHFLVQEYVAGRTLTDVLEEEGALSIERSVAIAAQIVTALGAAHQEGVFHRALSPEKILLLANVVQPNGDGRGPGGPGGDYVKIVDFGMAKLTDEDPVLAGDESDVTATGLRVGDPRYMAPEYIATASFNAKGDLYAVGGLLFHMVAGRPPFSGNKSNLLSQNVSTQPPRLSSVADGVPDWLDDLVRDLLAKTPERRPGVHKVLARLQDGVGHKVVLPKLIPLDSDGNVRAPEVPVPQRMAFPVVAVVVSVVLCTGAVGAVLVGTLVLVVVYLLSVHG